jgi:hypothetical protein
MALSLLKWQAFVKLPKSAQALGGPAEEEVLWKHYYEQRFLGQHPQERQSYKEAFVMKKHRFYSVTNPLISFGFVPNN